MRMVKTSVGRLYVGSKDDVLSLISKPRRQVFNLIWNLAHELNFLIKDERRYAKLVMWAGIKDYNIPRAKVFPQQLEMALDILKDNGQVLIHCMGGHGRTGMVLAILKKKLDSLSTDKALAVAEQYCDGPETEEQKRFVAEF